MKRPALYLTAALVPGLLLAAGCSERGLFREDRVAREAGNASRANQAIMATDMSPRVAKRKHIDHNGNRLLKGHVDYEANKSGSDDQSASASPDAEKGDNNLVDDL